MRKKLNSEETFAPMRGLPSQVTSVNPNIIAHTFTVFNGSKEVLNLPIVESSVIQAS